MAWRFDRPSTRAAAIGAVAMLAAAIAAWASFGFGAISSAGAPAPAAGEPSVADVQAAYDRAAILAGALHDKDLKIVGVDCHPRDGRQFSCQVGYVKSGYEPDRVFLDAALIERNDTAGWTLLRGLCRRLI